MFTGLVECTGQLQSLIDKGEGKELQICHGFGQAEFQQGDSIAINGVCLTVENWQQDTLVFYASYKTLELTNLGQLKPGMVVNMERAMLADSRLGGHMVQGHVDATGEVITREEKEEGQVVAYTVRVPHSLCRYIVARGSIAVDGISLTVVAIDEDRMELVIIPETIRKTNVAIWQPGVAVNLETDILARHIEKLMTFSQAKPSE